MQHKVGYAIGVLKLARNQANGKRYIEYLASDDAQNIYVKYGFVKANKEELTPKPIPDPKPKK
jgi:ABC-type Fe3+ transport system substrate-binding protein